MMLTKAQRQEVLRLVKKNIRSAARLLAQDDAALTELAQAIFHTLDKETHGKRKRKKK